MHGGGINNLTKDTADVTVTMQNSNLQADNVSIKAYNTPEMKSTATAVAAMQAGAFTGTIARSEATGRADIKSLTNNTYDAKKLNLLANSGFHDTDNVDKNKYTVYSDVTGIGANGVNIGVNKAITTNKMQANIDFDKANLIQLIIFKQKYCY